MPSDDELLAEVEKYLRGSKIALADDEPDQVLNQKMANVSIVWVDDDAEMGAQHMLQKHRVKKVEVEEVLLYLPPDVVEKEHPSRDWRLIFVGATRWRRWLQVYCDWWMEGGTRCLMPITAYGADDPET